MGSKLRSVVEKVRSQIESNVVGSGDYDYDLRETSGTPRVIIAADMQPSTWPCAMVYPMGRPSEETPGRDPLDSFTRVLQVQITGFIQAEMGPGSEPILDACDLADDIELALEVDPELGGLVYGLRVDYDVLEGAALGLPAQAGVVLMVVTVRYPERRAAT